MAGENSLTPSDYLARGILIGAGVGVLAGLLGIMSGIFWGAGLGMLAGFFAGLTMARRAAKKEKN